jgi:hypothetical protein
MTDASADHQDRPLSDGTPPEAQDMPSTPTTTQANRIGLQGGGVGQREMDAQQDPTRIYSQENTVADDTPQDVPEHIDGEPGEGENGDGV